MLVLLPVTSAFAETNVDVWPYVHYIPTELIVEEDSVKMEGYFVNLNDNYTVSDFTDITLEVYLEGDMLIDGHFDELSDSDFFVDPMSAKKHNFTFNDDNDLNVGEYVCDEKDGYYVVVTGSLSKTKS